MIPLLLGGAVDRSGAEVELWKIGGSGLSWAANDTIGVFVDVTTTPGALQPEYFSLEDNILSSRSSWSPFKSPTELDYIDGSIPRIWRAANGFYWYTAGVITPNWVDGDSLSYSPPVARGANSEWYTIDVGVPVPASIVGFFTPPRGVRADGSLLKDDLVPAFEISVARESDPVLDLEKNDNDYHRLETLVADVQQNFASDVRMHFPTQYVRYIRYKRNQSISDTEFARDASNVQTGTIGEFVLRGEGVPQRIFYISKIIDLGRTVNFGRLFWHATPMRIIDGVATPVEEAAAQIKVEIRSGRDDTPDIYHEFTDTGGELIVSREHFEKNLKQPDQNLNGQIQEGKPGLRASILYDEDNWAFWSFPLSEQGQQAPLERGRHIQLRVTLESESFFDLVRLDSLWLEVSPPLAQQVVGEVARLDNPEPERGRTEVSLGETTDFTYDIRSEFDTDGQSGFDALRIRTGSRPQFKRLEMGQPLVAVDPEEVIEENDQLIIHLPRRITRESSEPVRVVFGTEIFVFSNTFAGEVFDSQGEDLPQIVEGGDVSEEVNTGSLRVFGLSAGAQTVIDDLQFSSKVVTPNGDGINDEVTIDYLLFRLPQDLPVALDIYGIDGRLIAHLTKGLQGAGPQRVRWDGRDESGRLLAPGLYLMDLNIDSEFKSFRHLQPIGIAY
jgi:hypothetical protein